MMIVVMTCCNHLRDIEGKLSSSNNFVNTLQEKQEQLLAAKGTRSDSLFIHLDDNCIYIIYSVSNVFF